MRLIWKVTMLAAVPLLVLGQEADSGDDDDDATPKAGAAAGLGPYETILKRMPFGPLPPNFNPDAPPGTAASPSAAENEEAQLTEDEQQIVSSVRVSILNVTPSGAVAVGFTDSAAQPPANYYMKVGEKRDVWEVKEADPAEQTVVLVKNGVEATLKVGEGVAGGDKKTKGAARPMPSSPRGLMRAGGGPDGRPHLSGMDRLRARRMRSVEDMKAEEDRREAAAAEARKNAAQAAAEREQQREALMQIQEELRRQREEREQRAAQEAQEKPQTEMTVE